MYLIDTNVISEFKKEKSGRMDPRVQKWMASVPTENLYLSAISIFELERGVLRLERRDPRQSAILRVWLEEKVLRSFAERILPVNTVIARRCAALHIPDPRPIQDAFIAATALVHGMQVVTRNIRDYALMGVEPFSPWAYPV